MFIVVIVISILLKPTFWQISIYSQSLVKILWRPDKDKITFKAIEKYRYGLWKTISKHCWHSRFIQDPGSRTAVLKGTYRGRPSKQVLTKSLAWSEIMQLQFCSRRIDLTPTNYFLRPETRHRQINARNMLPFRLKPEISVSPV